MDQTFTCVLLLLSLSVTFGRFVYIETRKNWHDAQEYCRLHYTDLAFVSTEHEMDQVMQLAHPFYDWYWIGLVKNSTDREKWMWSGGGEVSRFFWAQGQPDHGQDQDYGLLQNYQWHDASPDLSVPFFCYSVFLVTEKKTWVEALEYCREHHRDLASVTSDAEMSLIKTELDRHDTTGHVWIGLHFFPGDWLWVDGQLMRYEAWGQDGKPECPDFKLECAALKHVWEAHDCEERLPFICH